MNNKVLSVEETLRAFLFDYSAVFFANYLSRTDDLFIFAGKNMI